MSEKGYSRKEELAYTTQLEAENEHLVEACQKFEEQGDGYCQEIKRLKVQLGEESQRVVKYKVLAVSGHVDSARLDKLERWLEEADGDNQFTYEAGNAEGGDGFFLEEGLEIISSAKNLREAIDKLENF